MENKKVYKIGDKIEVNDLEGVATGVVLKGLRVVEASGNSWASVIIEKKDIDTFEDLKQIVILEIIENNYTITKECYKKINKYLYNYKKDEIKNVAIVIDEESGKSNMDEKSYVEYLKTEDSSYSNIEKWKKIVLNELELTDRQKEILNIYSKINSLDGTAEILGISTSTVRVILRRIRERAQKMIYAIEY